MISQIANIHFAPTEISFQNLLDSGINKNIYISGNTVVDAISLVPDFKDGTLLMELYK